LSIVNTMICDRCGKREASVFIRREGSGEFSLCAECAREQGISAEDGRLRISLEDLFSPPPDGPERPGRRTVCAVCGIRLEEVRKSGRVGCPACYDSFREELTAFLQRRGRKGPYRGAVPRRFAAFGRTSADRSPAAAPSAPVDTEVRRNPAAAREDLSERLRAALDAEDYELAARLRDLLRSLGEEGA
jgi:protein arginine kinase activator